MLTTWCGEGGAAWSALRAKVKGLARAALVSLVLALSAGIVVVGVLFTASGAAVSFVLDNLNIHHAPDLLLCAARHPTWSFVYHPDYAAYLNLIEPWWKTLRSLALKGRRFATWGEICQAVG